MNVHDRNAPSVPRTQARLVYRQAARQDEPSVSARRRFLAIAAAPLLGSRFFFPRRFDRLVEAVLADPEAAPDLPTEQAAWYFGPDLHLDVDPAHLTQRIYDYVVVPGGAKWMGRSFLDGAAWDAVLAPIAKSPIHREMCDLVAAGNNYRDTRAYRNLVRAIELGRPSRRSGRLITNIDEIEAYLRYCLDVIESVGEHGIVRHRKSGAFHRLRVKHRSARPIALDSGERDISVAIGPDGQIVRHLGGKHRTAIAQALKLPRLPVEVGLVHVHWVAAQMKRTGLPAHLALRHGVRELRATASP